MLIRVNKRTNILILSINIIVKIVDFFLTTCMSKILKYLNLMRVKVSSLKHHPKNKEIYDLSSIDELMESISEVGLLQPLTIDTRNQVIRGNRRFESIKRLGWNKVEVIVILPILLTSNKGYVVLDPFMGSETVGKVFDKLVRNFVGYDLKTF